jgi:endonuclease YncB( thermonuclease family)
MQKFKLTKIAILILALFAGTLHIYTKLSKEKFKETSIFTHPEFKGYNLRFINVKYIYDGDTILLSDNTVIRYLGIDTPEIAHSADEINEPGL